MVGMTQGALASLPVGLPTDPQDVKRTGLVMAEPMTTGASSKKQKRPTRAALSLVAHESREQTENFLGLIGCVDALFTLLECYGMVPRLSRTPEGARVRKAYQGTLDHWAEGSAACSIAAGNPPEVLDWMKFVKYKTAAFFHSVTPQLAAPPPPPFDIRVFQDSPAQLCTGLASRYVRILLKGPLAFSFITSVSNMKKGCPRPSKQMVQLQVDKSVKALTTAQRVPPDTEYIALVSDWRDIDEFERKGIETHLDVPNVKAELRRTARELYYGMKFTDDMRNVPRVPTTKSTFDDTCLQGGGLNRLQRLAASNGQNEFFDVGTTGPTLLTFALAPRIEDMEDEYIGRNDNPIYTVDVRPLEAEYRTLYRRALDIAINEPALVRPIGLAESLKVRVITKGPSYTGFALKPLQKFLWSCLARHPAFTLIGKPVDKWTVQDRLGRKLPPGQAYLSGDYSAATDNLAPWVSETLSDEISSLIGLTDQESSLFKRALTQHVFVDDEDTQREQKWGQLMGSVVSFPILCVANAALCRWSLELAFKRKFTLADTSLLINGDDCLFRTTALGKRFWERITAFAGLAPSLGKYFFSRKFAQVNSANFVRRDAPHMDKDPKGKERMSEFDRVEYVNLGLLFGLKRSGERLGVDAVIAGEEGSLGTRAHELVNTCPGELKHSMLKMFISHHRKSLEKARPLPWFVPEAWGGVGLPNVRSPEESVLVPLEDPDVGYFGANYEPRFVVWNFKYSPTVLDRRVCARILEDPVRNLVRKSPAIGTWQMHKIALSRLPVRCEVGHPTKSEQRNWSLLYSNLVVDSVFTSGELIGDAEKSAEVRMRVLSQNAKVWTRVLHGGNLPPPLAVQTLHEETPGETFFPCEVISGVKRDRLPDVPAYGFADFEVPNLWL